MNETSLPERLTVEAQVSLVADEFMERLERGEAPDVDAYVRRHPDLAPVLRQMLPVLQVLRSSTLDPSPTSPAGLPAGAPPARERLGDFRLLREVGRGGMGVVYEAEQESLGRRVALKVLPSAAALDAKQLQRFQNEARAAAGLHHPHIVPVYAVGCENGVYYYAMQFIEGHTLAAWVEQLRQQAETGRQGDGETRRQREAGAGTPPAGKEPETAAPPAPSPVSSSPGLLASSSPALPASGSSFFRTVARLGAEAASALEHAHQLGIVHRDVKPANLLVDGRGCLWVTDFGLAHCQSQTALTLSGDLVGTLRYMSAEQALGRRPELDHRTDVYSLGATLYELLTLAPPFTGGERQELLRQIASEEPQPPRRLNAALPPDLETVVLKMLEKNPADRYATAQEAADDLQRFLNDEPVRARRPTPAQRARKWARRHRPVVWSALVASLVCLAVLAGSVGWVLRDRTARRARLTEEVHTALREARQSRQVGKLPQALATAQWAVALVQDGGVEPALDEQVHGLLGELVEEDADGRLVARLEALRLLQADTNARDNHFTLERALPDYRQAFQDYGLRPDAVTPEEAAARLKGRPAKVRGILLTALDHWLILARHQKAPELAWLAQVLDLADRDAWRQAMRAAREKNDREALERLAREADLTAQPPEALILLVTSLQQRGARQAAVALLRRAQDAFPADFWINENLGMALHGSWQYDEAIRFLTVAAALRPDSPGVRLNLGNALKDRGRYDEAIAAYRKAIELEPAYAQAYWNLSTALACQGRWEESDAAYRRARDLNPDLGNSEGVAELLRKAAQDRPADASAHFDLGNAVRALGQFDEAAADFRRAIALRPDFAEAHCNLGMTLRQQGNVVESLAELTRGHELGSRRSDWPYPSARWVEAGRRLVELDGRLPAVLRGEVQPADAAERIEYAELCRAKKLYGASARLFAEAIDADPRLADDPRGFCRYNAARAAAGAGGGRGTDAASLNGAERARWRKRALEWLRADLAAKSSLLETGEPKDRPLVVQQLRHWQRDPDLAGLRDPATVAGLPADEQTACRQFWAEVQALRTRASAVE